jgi:hypothetical protein
MRGAIVRTGWVWGSTLALVSVLFDLVCGTTHGCAPLPIGPDVIALLQRSDPRPLH